MKDFKISGSQDLKNASVEPNLTELQTDENEKTENLVGRAFMDKVFGRTKEYAYRRRHLYQLNPVVVDGIRYDVLSVTPQHTEEISKKAKELFAYLINGSKK